MFFYHGTSEARAKAILAAGIRPRGIKAGNWKHTVKSNRNAVYLTDSAFALHFANAASGRQSDSRRAIIEIDGERLNPACFVADEDAAEQTHGRDLGERDRSKRTAFFRDRLIDLAIQGFGHQESLAVLGTCAYLGPIPVDAIRRVAYLDSHANLGLIMGGCDPTISKFNRAILGNRYKHAIRCIFGDETPETPSGDMTDDLRAFVMHPKTWAAVRDGIEIVRVAP